MAATISPQGQLITESAAILRDYAALMKALIRAHAGWFLAVPAYEDKYQLAYALYDCSECMTLVQVRLKEMRGGKPGASVRPDLRELLLEIVDAPDSGSYIDALVNVLTPHIRDLLISGLATLDPCGNANEVRLLTSMRSAFENPWHALGQDGSSSPSTAWGHYVESRLREIGGLHGNFPGNKDQPAGKAAGATGFRRPRTIIFDERIAVGPLMQYDDRQKLDQQAATIEQFRVFFNEFYAAALLASVLFDAALDDYPWEFYADFSRHFWDECRHSQFGAIRLRELGVEPERVNPALFEEAESLPVLHRITYLTRGLEAYFMPRKPKRVREYLDNQDPRSQLFADQDWSDEINHVRYGSRWTEFLLDSDMRSVDDVIEEVKEHLTKLRGHQVTTIEAPF